MQGRSIHGKKSSPGNPQKHEPPDGVVLNALAFSTLLSSQGTDAHLCSAFASLRGAFQKLTGPIPFHQIGFLLSFPGTGGFREDLPDTPYVTGISRFPRIGGNLVTRMRFTGMSHW